MKRNSIFILAIVAVFIAAAGMKPVHQDGPPGKKKEAHIRIITVKDGKEQVVDTIIEGGKVRVFHSGTGKDFTWTTASHGKWSDSSMKHLEVIREDVDGEKVIIHRGSRGRGRGPVIITETETLGDSGKKVTVHVEDSGSGKKEVFFGRQAGTPRHRMMAAPFAPGMEMPLRRRLPGRNVIDLSDPGIISYEKKKLSGGREKITIIRNEVKETENKVIEIRTGEELNEEMIRKIPDFNREIKVKKEVFSPEPIEKK